MATETESKDCTALSDSEMAEMADLCACTPHCYEVGLLSKQAEQWVLVTQVREKDKLRGFAFSTLERIGGTPAVIFGLASVTRNAKRSTVLRAIMTEQLRRAVMAFPDEDVLIGARMGSADAFEAFRSLVDIVPRPGYKANGEERAWGKRLLKRFGLPMKGYDERAFIAKTDDNPPVLLSHESLDTETIDVGVAELFDKVDPSKGTLLIGFGWALADDLEKLGD
ncbi:MAG TPA: hypothetical protein VFN21_10115 [Acidimicrobiales bacterium]|nr:hypothetical protein [Acidimicrobiales bacterium]